MYSISKDEFLSHIRTINRTSKKDGDLVLEWSASGFELCFSGTNIMLNFEKSEVGLPIYIAYDIDGDEKTFAITSGKEVLRLTDLENTSHTLRVIRTTEARLDERDARLIVKGATIYGENAAFLTAPESKNTRKISFFGDSISCGYGVYGEDEQRPFNTADMDVRKCYAYLTAKELNADYHIVAHSGQGLVCSYNGKHGVTFPEFFEFECDHLRDNFDHSEWDADLVVISIGTNDQVAEVNPAIFKEAAAKQIKRVREAYKRAHIVWLYGIMGGKYNEVLNELYRETEDDNFSVLITPHITAKSENRGNAWHPSIKGQRIAADLLISHLKETLGW